jgi:hypothetical protein
MEMATPAGKSKADRYAALLARVQTIDLGGGNFWKVPQGKTTIRILPPVGAMDDAFFVESGQHYLGSKIYVCPKLSSGGKLPCPICDTNEGLYQSGKKKAASKFRASKSFLVNIVVRSGLKGGEDQQTVWQFGVTVMGLIISIIADPDYGDISDPEVGSDVVVTRAGEGTNTKYQVNAKRNPSPLVGAEQYLQNAQDLVAFVNDKVMDYDTLATESGVNVYLENGEIPEIKEEDKEEQAVDDEEADAAVPTESEEEEAPKPAARPPLKAATASSLIQQKLKARLAAK